MCVYVCMYVCMCVYITKTSNSYGSRVPHDRLYESVAPNDEPSYRRKPKLLCITGHSDFTIKHLAVHCHMQAEASSACSIFVAADKVPDMARINLSIASCIDTIRKCFQSCWYILCEF